MATLCKRLILIVLCIFFVGAPLVAGEPAQRRVLLLYSYSRQMPWTVRLISGVDQVVNALPLQDRPFIFEENFDSSRVGSDSGVWAHFLAGKYRNIQFDAVISESQQAAAFLLEQPLLFPGAPRYLMHFAPSPALKPGRGDEHRFVSASDIARAILLIGDICPKVRRVIVINDRSSTGLARTEQVRDIQKQCEGKLTLEVWDDFSEDELFTRIRGLGRDAALFYLPVLNFRDGIPVIPAVVAEQVAQASPVPVFTHFDSLFGTGGLGGYLVSGMQIGRMMGNIAVHGEHFAPQSQEAYSKASMGYYFDERAMKRWGISPDRLPSGSVILYHEKSFAERYWLLIASAIVAFSLETLLLVALVRLSRQRRGALALLTEERAGLAEKVRLRTADLAKVNEELVAEVAERERAERREQEISREKSVLLKELQHRVKNSMSIIASLVKLESFRMEGDEARKALEKLESRIKALATLYEILYDSGGAEAIQLQVYLSRVVDSVAESLGADLSGIALVREIDPCTIDLKSAITLGLIVNELVTDSLKYAFPDGRSGTILVRLHAQESGISLEVSDNGVGLPPQFNPDESKGFGFNLVKILCDQLSATLSIDRSDGTRFLLHIPFPVPS